MEQHPVPQNVTTFQFRLIGDMTIKQFGYLAGGAILAYIFYKLPLPFFFTWPLALIAALGGFGFAFVPIEERPMDVWVLSFLKSIYSPTQYVWSREAKAPPTQQQPSPGASPTLAASPATAQTPTQPAPYTPDPSGRRADVLQNIFLPSTGAPQAQQTPATHRGPLDWMFDFLTPKPRPKADQPLSAQAGLAEKPLNSAPTLADRMDFSPPPMVRPASTTTLGGPVSPASPNRDEQNPQVEKVIADTQEKEQEVDMKVKNIQKELETKPATDPQMAQMQAQLNQLVADRAQMEKELATLRNQTSGLPPVAPQPPPSVIATPPPSPPTDKEEFSQPLAGTNPSQPKADQPLPAQAGLAGTFASPPASHQPTVRIITPDQAVKVGLPRLTTFPNVVTGIVKDRDNNLLPGVLATVKDKDGVPLRALKTNRLGQFAASTPLPNGVYLVEIEDPRMRYTFDRAQITLNGSIVPALEMFAKSQKEITRAKLEKELFGKQT